MPRGGRRPNQHDQRCSACGRSGHNRRRCPARGVPARRLVTVSVSLRPDQLEPIQAWAREREYASFSAGFRALLDLLVEERTGRLPHDDI